jgi:hypothetical protein
MADFTGKIHASALHKSQHGRLFGIFTAALITNIPLTPWCNEMIFTEKIEIPEKVMICDDDYIDKPER